MRDEAEIRGHRRTYIGSIPGRIVQALKQAGSMNPVFMLDEIDKVSAGGFQGDPAAALLEVLDPAQNHSFRDHYLEIPVDLSKVLFIATSNQLGTVHPALLDRMEIISLAGYTEEEKLHIARQVPAAAPGAGARPARRASLEITDAALRLVISEYTREAGVRNLERQLGAIARKVAARIATRPADAGPPEKTVIDRDQVDDYLGPARFRKEVAFRTSRPGVATGVAWTETGGDVLFIEATLLPGGNQNIILTGQLGNVMQESARAALSHIRSRAEELGISGDFLAKHDLHVHVPAGAIPKDGPSAGVTMATAILSAARNQPVRQDVAMTGEITLSGLVLPVGGIREKALAARRFGIKTFVLPALNEPDLAELPEEVRRDMTFVPVETLEQVSRSHSRQSQSVNDSSQHGTVAWQRHPHSSSTSPATASATPRASSKSSTRSSRRRPETRIGVRTAAPAVAVRPDRQGQDHVQHARDRHGRRADRCADARRGRLHPPRVRVPQRPRDARRERNARASRARRRPHRRRHPAAGVCRRRRGRHPVDRPRQLHVGLDLRGLPARPARAVAAARHPRRVRARRRWRCGCRCRAASRRFSNVRDIPFIARHATQTREQVCKALKLPSDKPIVLASFGGYGLPGLETDALAKFKKYTVVTTANLPLGRTRKEMPTAERKGSFVSVNEEAMYDTGIRYEDLVGAAEAVVTKPGYGIISEAIANDTAILYTVARPLPRIRRARVRDAEVPCGTRSSATTICSPASGNRTSTSCWRSRRSKKKPETNGADVAAEILLKALDKPPKKPRGRPKAKV